MCPWDFMQKVNFVYVLRYIYLYCHIRLSLKRLEEALLESFCMKERPGTHVLKVLYIIIIRCLLLKYRLIFLWVLKVCDEPLGESTTERRVKISPMFQKKAPNIIFIIKSQNLKMEG